MKICLTIHSLQVGGMERVMSTIATFLAHKPDIEVHLLMYGIHPVLFYEIPSRVIVHKPDFRFNNKFRLYYTIKTMFYVRNRIKEIDPVSILSFGEYFNNLVLLSLIGLKKSIFVSDRCQPTKSLGFLHDLLRRWLYPQAAGVIVQTEKARIVYKESIKNSRLIVIGNPVQELTNPSDCPRENIVLTVGRLIKSKNIDAIIKAFASINLPGWRLVIVGDDALKQQTKNDLIELIRSLNFEDRITLTGLRDDVRTYYEKSKIFAFASVSEGFPNAIGEAMSAGLPVVAYDCIAGPSEMISDGHDGFLVPMGESKLFIDRLHSLMQNPDLREHLGSQAKNSIKRFSVNSICGKYYEILTNLHCEIPEYEANVK